MKLHQALSALTCVGMFAVTSASHAAVVNSADVAGFTTFSDTNTGRVWLDLNNFFNQTPTQMITAATSAGFTFATRSDVEVLLNSLPLNGGEWAGYNTIMGGAPNRALLWGAYDDVDADPSVAGWAFAFDNSIVWRFDDVVAPLNVVQNANSSIADLNLWAFQTGAVVPEPGSLALAGLALIALAGLRRREVR